MEVWLIILLSVLILILANTILYFSIVHYVFNILFKRMKKEVLLNEIDLSKTHYKDFMDITINNMNEFMKFEYQEVSIVSNDGLKLYGRYYDNNSDKTLLFFHGYHASPFNNINTPGLWFKEMGYNILLITERSHEKSEGKYITFGVKEKEDALLWFDFLKKQYSPKEIIVYGVSMGGAIVSMISDKLDDSVKALIIDSAFTGAYEEVLYSIKKKSNFLPGFFFLGIQLYAKMFGHFILEKSVAKDSLSKTNIPVFMIHGIHDKMVPLSMAKENFNVIKSKKYFFEADSEHAVGIYLNIEKIKEKFNEFMND